MIPGPLLRAGARVADLVYPRRCALCGGPSDALEGHWCAECLADAHPVHPPFCRRCGLAVAGRIDHAFTCYACEKNPPAYERARAAFRYEGVVRDAVHQFKYRRALWLERDLVNALEAVWRTHFDAESIDALVPVPLFRRRERIRGFNQAALLARELARRVGAPPLLRSLRRARDTGSQTKLTATARGRNVRGAFEWKERPACNPPASVALIDDVMTTGATVNECSRTLKKVGVGKVFVLTLARG